jgi:hypothetical protein
VISPKSAEQQRWRWLFLCKFGDHPGRHASNIFFGRRQFNLLVEATSEKINQRIIGDCAVTNRVKMVCSGEQPQPEGHVSSKALAGTHRARTGAACRCTNKRCRLHQG